MHCQGYIQHTLIEVRVFLILAFSLDRFASVFAPFLYPGHSLAFIIVNSVLAWLLPVTCNLMAIPQILDCYIYSKSLMTCTFSMSCSPNCKIFYSTYFSVLLFPAMAASLAFITALYVKGKKIRQQTSQMMGVQGQMTASDWKALKTFLLLSLTVIVVQTGIGLSFVLYHIINSVAVHSPMLQLAADFATLYVFIDPVVILRNADAREAMKTMMKEFTRKFKD